MQKQKREHFAFLDGYKPALIISPRNKLFETVLATDFPRITPFDDEQGSYIFFQNEEQKQDYERRMKGVRLRSYEFHRIVGEVLGFPKRSVEYFSKMRLLEDRIGHYPEEERRTGIGVNWAGFFFSAHIDYVDQEIKWLFDTYQHEKAVGLPVSLWTRETDAIEVEYGDLGRVKAIADTIKAVRQQKAAVTA